MKDVIENRKLFAAEMAGNIYKDIIRGAQSGMTNTPFVTRACSTVDEIMKHFFGKDWDKIDEGEGNDKQNIEGSDSRSTG